jgi:hypothetical protein
MDLMTREILIGILDISKIVYRNGITGTLILGDKLNKVFIALPQHFTVTDYDIHIPESSEMIKEEEIIKTKYLKFKTKEGEKQFKEAVEKVQPQIDFRFG